SVVEPPVGDVRISVDLAVAVPDEPGRPGRVAAPLLQERRGGGDELVLELSGLTWDPGFAAQETAVRDASVHLHRLAGQHDVTGSGRLPTDLSRHWRHTVSAAATRAAATGEQVDVVADGVTLTAVPRRYSGEDYPDRVTGPLFANDLTYRLIR